MKFLDSNIILYAYLRPKKGEKPSKVVLERKEISKEILKRIEEGSEEVVISTIHLGEILNIISAKLGSEKAILFLAKILSLKNVKIVAVSRETYEKALEVCLNENIEPNDAIAIVIMRKLNFKEIYTFDSDFMNIKNIRSILLEKKKSQ